MRLNAIFCVALVAIAFAGSASSARAQTDMPTMPSPDGTALPTEDQSLTALQNPASAPTATTTPASASTPAAVPPPTPSNLKIDASQLTPPAALSNVPDTAAAADDQARREQQHIKESYERAAGGLLPLSPEQIHDFMTRYEKTREAVVPPSTGQPKPQVRIMTLSLDPGADTPILQLATGYVTTINMMDSTGEPWPILDVGVGGNFEVTPTKAGSHVVRIMPLQQFAQGNLSILLDKLPTPIVFRLSTGQSDVDLRYDARVPKFGPNAKIPLINRPRLEAGNEQIMLLLQNAPPKDAKRLKVVGLDARTMAWSLGDHVFVRTPLTLLSPAWDASVSSDDGMTVYEIGEAPVLLMSDNGAMVRAQITRDEDQ